MYNRFGEESVAQGARYVVPVRNHFHNDGSCGQKPTLSPCRLSDFHAITVFITIMFLDKGSDVNLCPVCLASFQDPVILPCGHTLNRRCLQRIVDTSSIPRPPCPSCRATFDREEIFVPNKTLANVVQAKATAELFVIDIGAHHAQQLASNLLQRLFDER